MRRYSLISNDEKLYRKGLKHLSIGKQQCLKKSYSFTRNHPLIEHVSPVLLAARHVSVNYNILGLIKRKSLLLVFIFNKEDKNV